MQAIENPIKQCFLAKTMTFVTFFARPSLMAMRERL